MFEFAGVSALLLWFYCFTVMSIHPLVGGTTLIFFKIGMNSFCKNWKFPKFCSKCSCKLKIIGIFCLKIAKNTKNLLEDR
jgi:hypothetical protein